MAYWWVSQNQTYRQEQEGGYLWAPKSGANGVIFQHWSNMQLVKPGDVIFSYANQAIGAIGVASSAAYDAPQPEEFAENWHPDGRRVDVVYKTISPGMPLATFVDEMIPYLPERNSPITKLKTGVQGYLFAIPPKAGQFICERLAFVAPVEEIVADTLQQTVPDETTREALVKARIGQGRWRRDLLRHWSGKCAITGLDIEPLLRASHIKPWRDSNNRERLDVLNGFVLSPAYDAAFDVGLISFNDDGTIAVSPRLSANRLLAAGISQTAKLSTVVDEHRGYLAHHRQALFVVT
ncbi:HNH endonuclease [Phyllobacterium pellucidum]|uniref:HNH endonuclease n=1 Tax=Phyllobacterium pellucidum TaxID=2740464 RepID=UPI001D13FAB1|nr:HNH endonuclease [Phyllobacterium sp. T1018]UGY10187.1 HNH endonuclease [Phyllobacterium sp. T1018]